MRRIAQIEDEWIRRDQPVRFTFEGEPVTGCAGDTITSAVLAQGRSVLARSFKYHRPRGALSAANHDVNLVMQVEHGARVMPNVRADVARIQEGARVRAVNTRGGVDRDRGAIIERFARFLPVGFYYKAFHGKRLFPMWERLIRSMAGLGAVDLGAPRRETSKRYDFTDVLVIGAGPSGLAAALAAANHGASVMLVEENARAGGSGHYVRHDRCARDRTRELVSAVTCHPRIRVLTETYASGYYSDHWVALVNESCMIKVRARAVIVAQGAFEQPAVFHGNDLPGVMLASGAQRLMARYAVAPATRVVILTANAQGYSAAVDALDAGIEIRAILDLRDTPCAPSRAVGADPRLRQVPVVTGVAPHGAWPGTGRRIGSITYGLAGVRGAQTIGDIDGIWMSVGYAPAHALLHQAGARMRYETRIEQYIPEVLPVGMFCCGKANGYYAFASRISDGERAGAMATSYLGGDVPIPPAVAIPDGESPSHAYPIFRNRIGKEFVDFDEDLHVRDVENAIQEGFDSPELLKRYTTAAMGPSQGKHSAMNVLRIVARCRGESLSSYLPTTQRPMFHPVAMSHLAGRGFQPQRRTPVDAEHQELGAVWMPAGNWRRPEYYARQGVGRADAIKGEILAVRNAVGLIDVGTLGKVEAHGPAAGEFLDRVYAGRFSTLKSGMTRYGLMLDEAGVVIDDGVIGRLGAESFYFTTTTGNSGTLFREFGRLATQWGLQVGLVNLTGHYAAFNLAGPAARDVLQPLTDIDLADAAFPFLALREGSVSGVPCRLMRVGFVGELGYEIHSEADRAPALWRALLEAGQSSGIRPFGVEAQRMLRLEKGHFIVGQDSDGTTNALEINAPWALKMDKPFFIGQRSLRALAKQSLRQTLVGFNLPTSSYAGIRESHLILDGDRIAGRVTSVGLSPSLGSVIGLALVDPVVAQRGKLSIRIDRATSVDASVMPTPFYDPHGRRQSPGAAR